MSELHLQNYVLAISGASKRTTFMLDGILARKLTVVPNNY